MSQKFYVITEYPVYGTGHFNYGQTGFTDLLNDLEIYDYYDNSETDTSLQIDIPIKQLKEAIVKLKTVWKNEMFFWGNIPEDEGYSAHALVEIFEKWLSEIKHDRDYLTIEML